MRDKNTCGFLSLLNNWILRRCENMEFLFERFHGNLSQFWDLQLSEIFSSHFEMDY